MRPNLTISDSTLSSSAAPESPVLSLAANLKHSLADIVSIRMSSCCTNAPIFPKSLELTVLLLHLTSPLSIAPGESANLYARTFSNDVFPDPLAPIIATISFGFAYPVTFVNIYFMFLLFLPLTTLMLGTYSVFMIGVSRDY